MKNDAILYGNGFNLLSENCPSWQELLTSISNKSENQILKETPPTLQYEQVYLAAKQSSSSVSESKDETDLKEKVRGKLSVISTNEYYKKLLELGVSTFLTTNYDHAIYDNKAEDVVDGNSTEKIYSIRRWKRIALKNSAYTIFPIHGDITNVKSIMLGLDHYGGALAKVQDYVKGKFVEKTKEKEVQNKSEGQYSIYRRLKSGVKFNGEKYGFTDNKTGLVSWIDAFFFTNLHIIGITLDFSEIDIWWLLSKRARLLKDKAVKEKIEKHKIYYYPTFPLSEIHLHLSKLRLLECMGVKVVYHTQMADIKKGKPDYRKIYDEQLENIENNIKKVIPATA